MKRSTLAFLLLLAAGLVPPAAGQTAEKFLDWPLGLGTIKSVERRYPTHNSNAAALRLLKLGPKIEIDFEHPGPPPRIHRHISDYLDAQVARVGDRIDPLPKDVAAFFESHDRDIKAIRDLLVVNPVVWPVNLSLRQRAPMPNLRPQITLTRMLVARAVALKSWDDLRAASNLQRGLWSRPEMLSQLVAMSSTRFILWGARKIPGPPPPWAAELLVFDARRGTIAAMQWEAWLVYDEIHTASDSNSVGDQLDELIRKPFVQMVGGNYHEVLRKAAVELEKSRACAFDGSAFDERIDSEIRFWDFVTHFPTPYFGAYWQRAVRLTAERELTERVFAIRSGRPAPAKSACSDGTWSVTTDASGAVRVKFSREIPVRRPLVMIPLEQVVARTNR